MSNMMVFTGNSNPDLANRIIEQLALPMGQALVSRFSDGEINVEIQENVRGADVFVIQSTCVPTNRNLMEMIFMIDALRRAPPGVLPQSSPILVTPDRIAGYARPGFRSAPRWLPT